jgi:hypothetical protein
LWKTNIEWSERHKITVGNGKSTRHEKKKRSSAQKFEYMKIIIVHNCELSIVEMVRNVEEFCRYFSMYLWERELTSFFFDIFFHFYALFSLLLFLTYPQIHEEVIIHIVFFKATVNLFWTLIFFLFFLLSIFYTNATQRKAS